jgi:hypothetical protein
MKNPKGLVDRCYSEDLYELDGNPADERRIARGADSRAHRGRGWGSVHGTRSRRFARTASTRLRSAQ